MSVSQKNTSLMIGQTPTSPFLLQQTLVSAEAHLNEENKVCYWSAH